MSEGSSSSYVGACRKDIPYPSVSSESVPSLIDNLVYALYGTINKSVINRRVVWNIPCDPNNSASVSGIPRNTGEGLLCYILRVFSNLPTINTKAYANVTDAGAVVAGSIYPTSGLTITGPVSGVFTITGSSSVPITSTNKVLVTQTSGSGYAPRVTFGSAGSNSCTITTYSGSTPAAQSFSFVIF